MVSDKLLKDFKEEDWVSLFEYILKKEKIPKNAKVLIVASCGGVHINALRSFIGDKNEIYVFDENHKVKKCNIPLDTQYFSHDFDKIIEQSQKIGGFDFVLALNLVPQGILSEYIDKIRQVTAKNGKVMLSYRYQENMAEEIIYEAQQNYAKLKFYNPVNKPYFLKIWAYQHQLILGAVIILSIQKGNLSGFYQNL